MVLAALFVFMSSQVSANEQCPNGTSGNGTNSTSPGNATNATYLISTTGDIQSANY